MKSVAVLLVVALALVFSTDAALSTRAQLFLEAQDKVKARAGAGSEAAAPAEAAPAAAPAASGSGAPADPGAAAAAAAGKGKGKGMGAGPSDMMINPVAKQMTDLTASIKDANTLVNKLNDQIGLDTATATDWFTVIQNYQFKYSALLERIKTNTKKYNEMSTLLNQLKAAKTHKDVQAMIAAADADFGTMAANAAEDMAEKYQPLGAELEGLKKAMSEITPGVEAIVSNNPTAIATVNGALPQNSADTLAPLVKPPELPGEGDGDGEAEEPAE